MNIAVNTQLLMKDRIEGIGRFSLEILKRITRAHPEHRFYFIFDRPWSEEFLFADNVIPLRTLLPSRHPLLWYLRFHFELPYLFKKHDIDLYYSPDGWGSSAAIPTVISLHDINFHHRPEQLPFSTRWYYRTFFPKYARRARALTTVSHFSRGDIAQHFHIPAEKISVVPNAVADGFRPASAREAAAARLRWADGQPYFIFIGALNPRKNIGRLLQAFDAFSAQRANEDVRLVIAGQAMWAADELRQCRESMRFTERVHFTGRLSDAEVANCLAAAQALLFPSLFEGFGIPLLEAMACEVPVLTSATTALPEVAGDAALFVNPESVDEIAEGIHRLATEAELRASLIALGRERVKAYSWDDSAKKLWNVLEAAGRA